MNKKEFKALLAIEDRTLDMYIYQERFWVGEVVENKDDKSVAAFVAKSEDELIEVLSIYCYGA